MKTILLIDDDLDFLKSARALFAEKAPYQLLTAESGVDGVNKARASRPILILLDINMQGLSGMDVKELLKNDNTTRDIPIVYFSAIVPQGNRYDPGRDQMFPKADWEENFEELLGIIARLTKLE